MRCNRNCRLLIVADRVVTMADNVTVLSNDVAMQELCTEVSDIVASSQMDRLTASGPHELSTSITLTTPTATVSVVSNLLEDVSAAFQCAVEEPSVADSTTVPGIQQQAAAASTGVIYSTATPLSPASQNNTGLGDPTVSGNTATLGNPRVSGTQTVSVHEYCQAFEQWAWQYYWWMLHVQWMTWAAYMSVPMHTAMSCIPSTSSGTQSAMPAARPVGLQQQQQPAQQQQQIPQPPRGNTSEHVCQFCVEALLEQVRTVLWTRKAPHLLTYSVYAYGMPRLLPVHKYSSLRSIMRDAAAGLCWDLEGSVRDSCNSWPLYAR